ncbi:MAG: DUF488 domain-containing protein [Hyphomicrobiales bacterium]|nr:DUF488 domain-containing protein [Hyphomicrobiales bacterium]
MLKIHTKRIYENASRQDGFRVLVDRIWPRGVSKEDASIDYWAKDLAPSTELRKWFDHDPDKWDDFKQRYRDELRDKQEVIDDLMQKAGSGPLTLLFSARDQQHNQAIVLQDVLEKYGSSS